MDILCTITDEENKVLESWLGVGQIQPWLQHALDNKLRQRLDATIIEVTDKNPAKLSQEDKLLALKDAVLPTKDERDPTP